MTDQELLELAARAFDDEGIHVSGDQYVRFLGEHEDKTPCFTVWNPLLNDADAFQLMVKLSIRVHPYVGNGDDYTTVTFDNHDRITLDHNDDAMAATRRAIVLAAAEIGKGM